MFSLRGSSCSLCQDFFSAKKKVLVWGQALVGAVGFVGCGCGAECQLEKGNVSSESDSHEKNLNNMTDSARTLQAAELETWETKVVQEGKGNDKGQAVARNTKP